MDALYFIPFQFVYDNYYILEYNKDTYDFRFKRRLRYHTPFEGSVGEFLDKYLHDPGQKEYKIALKVRDNAERIINLHEILCESYEVDCEFLLTIASEWIYTSQSSKNIPYYLLDVNQARTYDPEKEMLKVPLRKEVVLKDDKYPQEKDPLWLKGVMLLMRPGSEMMGMMGDDADAESPKEPDDLISATGGSLLARRLNDCQYSVAHERKCNFLARLATSWSSVKRLYALVQGFWTSTTGVVNLAKEFVNQFVAYKKMRDALPYLIGRRSEKAGEFLKAFERIYSSESLKGMDSPTYSDLATEFNCTAEYVRQSVNDTMRICRNVLKEVSVTGGGYAELYDFVEELRRLTKERKMVFVRELYELEKMYSLCDPSTKRFIFDLAEVSEGYIEYTNEQVLVGGAVKVQETRRLMAKLVNILKKHPFPFDLDADLWDMVSEAGLSVKPLPEHYELARAFVEGSRLFEQAADGERYQVKYKYLSTKEACYARILMESDAPSMSKQDIIEEYYRRIGTEMPLSTAPLTVKSEYIQSVGKTGHCVLVEKSKPMEIPQGMQQTIREYVEGMKRPFTLLELEEALKDQGIKLYSKSSIREYIRPYASYSSGLFTPKKKEPTEGKK